MNNVIDSILIKINNIITENGEMVSKGLIEPSEAFSRDGVLLKLREYILSLKAVDVTDDDRIAAEEYVRSLEKPNKTNEPFNLYGAFIAGVNYKANQVNEMLNNNVVLETKVYTEDDGCAEDFNYQEWLAYEDNEITEMPEWCKDGDKIKFVALKG